MGLGGGGGRGGWWVQANFGQFSIGGGGDRGGGGRPQAEMKKKIHGIKPVITPAYIYVCTLYNLVTGKLFANPIPLRPVFSFRCVHFLESKRESELK